MAVPMNSYSGNSLHQILLDEYASPDNWLWDERLDEIEPEQKLEEHPHPDFGRF